MELVHLRTLAGDRGGAAQFEIQLTGVAVDPADRPWACGDDLIKAFSPEGQLQSRFSVGAPAWSLCAEGDLVWVGLRGAIVAFDRNGGERARIDDPERLGHVTGVAAADGLVIAADATHGAIHAYTRDGQWLRDIGGDVNTRGFMIPNGVLDLSLEPDGASFVVAHPQKHRVERYETGGKLLGKWGRFGMHAPGDFGGCCNPTNVAAGLDGLIAVSEKAPPRVKLYARGGDFLGETPPGLFDENTKNIDLALDSRGRLYATDPARRAIEVFELVLETAGAP